MYEHLNDPAFLDKLFRIKIREQYIKIILLDFFEKPIREIQGMATSGNVSVNGSSAVRRTINLTIMALAAENDLTDIDNLISVNKKIKVEVGLKNPFPEYDRTLWFPQGTYVLATANCALSTSGCNISITGKDKMVMLDGTVGGTLPASITVTKKDDIIAFGEVNISVLTMAEIIFEFVHHYGQEPVENIFIEDLDGMGKEIVKYIGDQPIYFNDVYSYFTFEESDIFNKKIVNGQDAGYSPTPLIYPGDKDLVLAAGDTVTSLLDKIVKVLGNYEYFYDLNGKFRFRMIGNYKTINSPLSALTAEDYFKYYGDDKYMYSITDSEALVSINTSPKLDNIKNDFLVWGARTAPSGQVFPIRYHAVIAEKPTLYLVNKSYLYSRKNERLFEYKYLLEDEIPELNKCWGFKIQGNTIDLQALKGIEYGTTIDHPLQFSEVEIKLNNSEKIYSFSEFNFQDTIYKGNAQINQYITSISFPQDFLDYKTDKGESFSNVRVNSVDTKNFADIIFTIEEKTVEEKEEKETGEHTGLEISFEYKVNIVPAAANGGWREELYRQALLDEETGTQNVFEQAELIAEWRKLFNPNNTAWKEGWNPYITEDPSQIDYWLDYIDYPKYSVEAIGRRTKAVTDDKIKALLYPEIPNVVFIGNKIENQEIIKTMRNNGENVFLVTLNDMKLFDTSTSGATALDKIRELIQNHMSYNNSISITCIPQYHFEPNKIIHIENKKVGVNGNYVISQFSIPLTYNGTMSITATEVIQSY